MTTTQTNNRCPYYIQKIQPTISRLFRLADNNQNKKMSVSSLSFTPPKLQTLQAFTTKPTTAATFKACSSHQSTPSINKKQIFQVGVGILAASIVSSAPLNADATRIEYYATTAEPTCEFNYVHSGLGYCDLAVGSGEEAPYNQLVNVSLYVARFIFWEG